jgi:hypothetical protein
MLPVRLNMSGPFLNLLISILKDSRNRWEGRLHQSIDDVVGGLTTLLGEGRNSGLTWLKQVFEKHSAHRTRVCRLLILVETLDIFH